jgi:hypothetical protein
MGPFIAGLFFDINGNYKMAFLVIEFFSFIGFTLAMVLKRRIPYSPV